MTVQTSGTDVPGNFDVIVVGGGTSGCIVANRLSADPARKVLLVEAGIDCGPEEPADVLSTYPLAAANPAYLWKPLKAQLSGGAAPRFGYMSGGRMLGGSSAINGLLAIRGLPSDYDDWAALGLPGWDWASVEPYFRVLETDLDFDGAGHGLAGPLTVHRQAGALTRPVMQAVAQACRQRDLPFVSDVNTDFRDGYFISPISADAQGRMSTNRAYLTAEVRARPNLAIVTGAACTRLLFDGRAVSGVELTIGDKLQRVSAPAVFLCAGAYHTPALMQRSGVGPSGHLRDLGISVIEDKPGVGANLRNHPFIPLGMVLERKYISDATSSACCGGLRLTSKPGVSEPCDVYLSFWDRAAWHAFGSLVGIINIVLHKPYSVGSVSIGSSAPEAYPAVDFNFLSDERDVAALSTGVQFALDLLADPSFTALSTDNGLLKMKTAARMISMRTPRNRLASAVLGSAAGLLKPLERKLLDLVVKDIPEGLRRWGEDTGEALREAMLPQSHPVGSCAMGRADDGYAVTDAEGRVHGLGGLHIADASIFPSIPRANTNIPVMMVAEKIATDYIGRS